MTTEKLVGEGTILCEADENPFVKLTEHFYELGCREFMEENGVLWLRWPDGRQQKITLVSRDTVQ